MNSSSSPNLPPSAPQPPINPFLAPPVLPGPPGLPVVGSSSPALQVQPLPAYPPLYPAMNASSQPQGLWLQPHPMGAAGVPPRPLYLPYNPAVFPAPFSVATLAAPLPAISVPDSRPPAALELPPGIDAKNQVQEVGGKDNASLMSGEEASPNAWTAHRTETGVVYYYNAVTGVSTYEKPPGFMGEPEKVHVQPTPVSMENLAGTDWALITTNDGKTYYYNTKTKLSSWQIPGEVTEFRKKQEAEISTDQRASVSHTSISSESGAAPITLSAPAVATGGREASGLRVSSFPGSTSALDLIKRKLQDTGSPHTSSPTAASLGTMVPELNGSRAVDDAAKGLSSENNKDIPKDSNGDGNASDSSSDSEDEENGPTKEDCVIQFKEMLKERGVAPFSKWEKELPKIVFDPRFQAIPSHSARRSLFEHYVKTRAEEERKEKRAAQKAAIEGFKQLLEEASEDIHHNTDYHTLKKKWGNDPRFDALDRKDREHLLNERILPLKKAAQEKAQAEHAAAAASFKSMLRDKGDITVNSRWSRVKDILRDDPRYKSVKHEDREVLFNEYLSELKASEEEAEREAKARKEEQEKLKERERELRKRKEREEQEMERVRLKIRRKDAVASFQALLVETIKDPQASWTESKPKLEKDPQGRATHPDLDPSETEKFFREHVKMLYERCVNDFKALLTEVITPEAAAEKTEDGKTVLDSWSTAKRLLKPHPRYNKMPRKERELLWRRHAEEMQRKQKLALDTKEDRHADPKGKGSTYSGESKRSSNRK